MTSNYDAYSVLRERIGHEPHPSWKDVQVIQQPAQSIVSSVQPVAQFNIKSPPEQFIDWSAMTTGLSYQRVYTATSTAFGLKVFSMGPKPAGNLADIASLTIRVANTNITSAPGYLPIWNYLRYMFRTTPASHSILGPLLGMGDVLPHDEMRAWYFTGVSGAVTNHNSSVRPMVDIAAPGPLLAGGVAYTVAAGALPAPALYNKGLYSRILDIAYSATAQQNVQGRNVVSVPNGTTTWTSQCFIPMCFLHSFFEKCGVLKGVELILTVNFNNTADYSAAGNALGGVMPNSASLQFPGNVLGSSGTVSSGNIVTFQQTEVANAGAVSEPTGSIAGALALVSASQGPIPTVFTYLTATATAVLQSRCGAAVAPALYLTIVTPHAGDGSGSASSDMAKMSSAKKTVVYSDHQFNTLSAQAAGAGISWTIASSALGVQRVYVLGYLTAAEKVDRLSPFHEATPEPFYSHPSFALDNPQFLVAGTPVKGFPTDYQFRDFLENILTLSDVNGGQTPYVSSGLYSKRAWDICKIYCVDVSRNTKALSGTSLELRATLKSAFACDLLAIYEQSLEVTIDQSVGAMAAISPASIPVLTE